MSGAPDFFYREAQRLGYAARAAFKVGPLFHSHSSYKYVYLMYTHSLNTADKPPCCAISILIIKIKTASSDTEATQAHNARLFRSGPRLCSWGLASGIHSFTVRMNCIVLHWTSLITSQVACQSLGPLEKGGLVAGIDIQV